VGDGHDPQGEEAICWPSSKSKIQNLNAMDIDSCIFSGMRCYPGVRFVSLQ
jgi:hypothetical protein